MGRQWIRHGVGCVLAVALSGCGDATQPAAGEPPAQDAFARAGWTQMSGLWVPPRGVVDPGLPDSCVLLTESDPLGVIGKPLGPVLRMADLCIAHAQDTPTLEHSLQVELRRPAPFELERGLPTDRDRYWEAEGGSVEMMGGTREGIEDLAGIGDYAVWYPIGDGFMLQAYWQGRYVLRLTMRGIDREVAWTWGRRIAQRALEATSR